MHVQVFGCTYFLRLCTVHGVFSDRDMAWHPTRKGRYGERSPGKANIGQTSRSSASRIIAIDSPVLESL